MRLLAVRGENLASLGRFEIDLSAPPLAGAGLFAVTGETGAGKSTLLDALCLALYGTHPRVAGAGIAKTPDPSGETLTVGDPRAILSRGAGQGHAEVDFVGSDDLRYRVRWGVGRARGRAHGRLQPATHVLSLLSDGSAVAAGLSSVAEAIPLRTGLTYAQFVRTVLLPQGAFDAFLTAPEGERASVLERITDTGIYAALSTRVHREAGDRRRTLDELRSELRAVGLLSSEERATLQADLVDLRGRIAAATGERATLAHAIERALQVVRAEELLNRATGDLDAARRAHDRSGEVRARLETHDAVEPLRGLEADLRRAEEDRRRAVEARREAEQDLGILQAEGRQAGDDLGMSLAALAAANQAMEGSKPDWDEAEALDAALTAAWHRETSAAEVEDRAGERLSRSLARAEAARGALHGLTQKRRDVEDALRATVAHDGLADAAERIPGMFEAHASALARRDAQVERLSDLRRQGSAWRHGAEEASSASSALIDDRAALDRLATSLRERKEALDLPGLLARQGRVDRLSGLLTEAHQGHRRHERALAERDAAERDAAQAREDAASAGDRGRAAREARLLAEAERRGIVLAVDRAEDAASHEAARLRSALVPGEACPVCGAMEHSPASRSDLDRLVAEFRSRRDALDAEVGRTTAAAAQAVEAEAAAAGRVVSSRSRSREATQDIAEIMEATVARAPAITDLMDATGVAVPLPALDADDARGAWAFLSKTMVETRTALAASIEAAQALGTEIDGLATRRRTLDARIEVLSARVTEANTKAHAVEVAAGACEAALEAATDVVAGCRGALLPFLASCGLSGMALDTDPAGTGRLVADLAETRLRLRREAGTLDATIAVASETVRGATEAAADAERARHEAEVGREVQRQAVAELQVRRDAVLGGEALSVHRGRVEASVRMAVQVVGEARTAEALAAAATAGASEHAASAADEVARTAEVVGPATVAMAQACAALGRDRVGVAELLATPRRDVEAWRVQVSVIAQAVTSATAIVEAREADLAQARAEAVGVEVPADASERLLALDATADQWTRDVGALEHRLGRDDGERGKVSSLEVAIAVAEADHAVWSEVDAAIGSAGGERFRLLAQEITLDALVALANEQLVMLTPRYRLARGDALALHVADQDMGGEVRSSRSLSGGERFLVSLGLALALSGLEGRQGACDVLLIDEGFGSLDSESLDVAVEALETLQGLGRKVGVVTHVQAMVERIPTQVRVIKRGGGRSVVETKLG